MPALPVPRTSLDNSEKFASVLHQWASADGTVIMAVGERNYCTMLENFVLTSVLPFRTKNFVVVAMDRTMCAEPGDAVPQHEVGCYHYPHGENLTGGYFGSPDYSRLVNVKTEVVLAALKLGFHVMFVDADIVFLQNPQPFLDDVHDLQAQRARRHDRICSGFFFVRSTPWGIAFIGETYRRALKKGLTARQQPTMNSVLSDFKRKPFRVRILGKDQFPIGVYYFNKGERIFSCPGCVVVHNNWIRGAKNKEFRFKEHLMWVVDDPPGYYSSQDTKYLEFGNPELNVSQREQRESLIAAFLIAAILERVVILPPMGCQGCDVNKKLPADVTSNCEGLAWGPNECTVIPHLSLSTLYDSLETWRFRERMFRFNPLVPPDIKLQLQGTQGRTIAGAQRVVESPEPPFLIATPKSLPRLNHVSEDRVLWPRSRGMAVSSTEIAQYFGQWNESRIIRLDSLYGVSVVSSRTDREHGELAELGRKIRHAFAAAPMRRDRQGRLT